MTNGYFLMTLTEDSKESTAFTTPYQAGQSERRTFGMTNSAAVFRYLMNRVLRLFGGEAAVTSYLDDVLTDTCTEVARPY